MFRALFINEEVMANNLYNYDDDNPYRGEILKSSVPKWEYKVVSRSQFPGDGKTNYNYYLENQLDELGRDGWELCNCDGYSYIFKRQKE